jgi:hypothetical protein
MKGMEFHFAANIVSRRTAYWYPTVIQYELHSLAVSHVSAVCIISRTGNQMASEIITLYRYYSRIDGCLHYRNASSAGILTWRKYSKLRPQKA